MQFCPAPESNVYPSINHPPGRPRPLFPRSPSDPLKDTGDDISAILSFHFVSRPDMDSHSSFQRPQRPLACAAVQRLQCRASPVPRWPSELGEGRTDVAQEVTSDALATNGDLLLIAMRY